MNGKLFFVLILAIFLALSPVSAYTNKIPAGAPIFVGESDLDITPAVKDCHIIGWWPDGNATGKAVRNLTLKQQNEANGKIAHFNVSPDIFRGYTGNWYCEDKVPHSLVLNVIEPTFTVRAWDLDHDRDVTGQSVPFTANITYRIDTNLNQVLSYSNRTDLNPSDSFYNVNLFGPAGKRIPIIYTGNLGASDTQLIFFDSSPFITTPTYFGKNLGSTWNRLSRDTTGGLIYSPGVYTFTASQNLNHMYELYQSYGSYDLTGITNSSASIRILPPEALPMTAPTTNTLPESPAVTSPTSTPPTPAVAATSIPVTAVTPAKKATYAPLPLPVVLAALGIAGILIAARRS